MYARDSRPLERSGVRYKIMRLLAAGEVSQSEIARQYGVSAAAVSYFNTRHAAQIAEIKSNLEDEFAGLVFANKASRLDALTRDIELCDRKLHESDEEGEGSDVDPAWARVKAAALRQFADELGQIPVRAPSAPAGDVVFTMTIPGPAGADTEEE